MKKNYIFLSLLLAGSVTLFQCSDDKDEPKQEPKQECYPTELPAEGGNSKLTYNGDNLVTDVEFENVDEPESKYTMKLEYANNKLSKVTYFQNDEMESYKTFTYDGGKIIESDFWEYEGGFEEDTRYVYRVENERIISMTRHEGWNGFIRYDSAVYTYDSNENITKAEEYGSDHILDATATFTYDDKISPFHTSGIDFGDGEFFGIFSLSKNNLVKGSYSNDEGSDSETVTYTYDAEGKPTSMKFDWQEGDAYTITWNCK